MTDADLGALKWNEQLEWWEGSIRLSSSDTFELVVFARAARVADRAITAEVRRAIVRIRMAEDACRSFACQELLEIHNAEWSEGRSIAAGEFIRRLQPESVEVHESGYCEVHFRDGDLYWGHRSEFAFARTVASRRPSSRGDRVIAYIAPVGVDVAACARARARVRWDSSAASGRSFAGPVAQPEIVIPLQDQGGQHWPKVPWQRR